MKKNRIQRLQEDMNEDLQKYLDEDLLDTTPKRKKESMVLCQEKGLIK